MYMLVPDTTDIAVTLIDRVKIEKWMKKVYLLIFLTIITTLMCLSYPRYKCQMNTCLKKLYFELFDFEVKKKTYKNRNIYIRTFSLYIIRRSGMMQMRRLSTSGDRTIV